MMLISICQTLEKPCGSFGKVTNPRKLFGAHVELSLNFVNVS